jgi:hypothetical protein
VVQPVNDLPVDSEDDPVVPRSSTADLVLTGTHGPKSSKAHPSVSAAAVQERLGDVAKVDNDGWSLYEASGRNPWQPVANAAATAGSTMRCPSSTTTGESTSAARAGPVYFWHSDDEKNGPLLAIERLIAEIPGASLRVWSDEGLSAPARHLDDILHDLIDAADGER